MAEPTATQTSGADEVRQSAHRRRVRLLLLLQAGHLLVLALLVGLFLIYAVQTNLEPVSGWVADTPVERICRRMAPFLWEQQQRLRVTMGDSVLLPEEKEQARTVLARMEAIRPTHALITRDQRQLFGRLREEDGGYLLELFDGQRFSLERLTATDIVWRKAIVLPDGVLTAGDLRFLLRNRELNAYYVAPYLFVSKGGFGQIQPLYQALSSLGDEFAQVFGPVCESLAEPRNIRVCHFPDQATFLREVQSRDNLQLVNSLGFFSETDQTLYFYGDTSWPQTGGGQPAAEEGTPPLAVLRHEGAHQLVAALGVVTDRPHAPLWLQEGLAQYCESIPVGAPDERRLATLRVAAAEGTLLPWTELLHLTPATRDRLGERQWRIFYAQSWLVFHQAMQRSSRPLFYRYLLALKSVNEASPESDPEILLMNNLETTPSTFYGMLDRTIGAAPAGAP